jgi:hypothetical protein
VTHDRRSNRDYLAFGATIWNAGPGLLDVEGFRSGVGSMTATQFVHRGDRTQTKVIGQFEFDTRPGHHHWHLEDVAQYDLLDSEGHRLVRSEKQSFCLAPTDPIDLTIPGALWQPDRIGLGSSCPDEQSLWLRETMPVGWGDTYYQAVAGQSFDITDLPNGRYIVRVVTNPFGHILETTADDNTSLLAVQLSGQPKHRKVTELGPVT